MDIFTVYLGQMLIPSTVKADDDKPKAQDQITDFISTLPIWQHPEILEATNTNYK